MSQCKRACVFSITENCFTHVFGDMDPGKENHVEELLNLISIYSSSEEGFMRRRDDQKFLDLIFSADCLQLILSRN